MPAPQFAVLSELVKTNFRSKGIVVPTGFKGFPSDPLPPEAKDKPDPMKSDKQAAPPPPTCLFKTPSSYKLHAASAQEVSKQFEEIIDAFCQSLCTLWSAFHSGAKLMGVIINASVGILPPGGLAGPPVEPGGLLAGCGPAGRKPTFVKHCQSMSQAVGSAFTSWVSGYTVPGLMYPTGALSSVSMVPAPNIPIPVAMGSSPGDGMMTAGALKGVMMGAHGAPGNHTEALFDSVSSAVETTFTQWKSSSQINLVMGAGGVAPVPPLPPGPVAVAIGMGGMLT
jgi:hypothetical protein